MTPPIDYTIEDFDKVLQYDGTIKNIKTSRLTAPGENYLSLVLRVEVDVEKKNGEIEKKDIVAKRIPLGKREFIEMNIHSMRNEILWYTEIISILTDFSQQYGIDCSHLYPTYCGSRLSLDPSKQTADQDSLLLVENLNPEGYRNDDRLIGSDFITCKTILKDLALFHVIPLAMKLNRPEKFKVLKDYITSFRPDFPHPEKKDVPPHLDEAKLLIKSLANIPECAPHMKKLEPLLDTPLFERKYWREDGPEPWSTIIHSDFWVNNILVKPGSEGNVPAIKFVDFQVCGYKSFVTDVIFFLLTSAQNEIQKTRLDDLLKIYYEEFIDLLQKFKIDLKLSYEEYLTEISRVLKQGELNHVIVFCIIILAEKNSVADVAVEDVNHMELMCKMMGNLTERQKARLTTVINEVIKRNWI